ncbi:MAG: hypothetical protein J07HQW1_00664 [Haloquadratum walsbyi J07HQW1]|uniref:Uncharacterized protein n=1 Tax=Haloquadratum walsbyi J07HQW1 TaxID=1238424 RepID=U1N2B1_9EURY|nr:MAG: hypothetical protein J07HQW1_00664 [Haloquadratum walsbyi J07HQW1]
MAAWWDARRESNRPLGRPIDRPRDIDLWRGRLDNNLVNEAVAGLVEELH